MTAAAPSEGRPGPAARALAALLAGLLAWVPWALVWGDDLRAGAAAGQSAGSAARAALALPAVAADGSLLIPAAPEHGLPAQSLAPAALFPGSGGALADFTDLYGDDPGLRAAGLAAGAALADPADPAAPARAFQALLAGAGRARPDRRIDPLWHGTDWTLEHLDSLVASFADCARTTTFHPGTLDLALTERHTCERPADPAALGCVRTRTVHAASRVESCPAGTVLASAPVVHGRVEVFCHHHGDLQFRYTPDWTQGSCSGPLAFSLPRSAWTQAAGSVLPAPLCYETGEGGLVCDADGTCTVVPAPLDCSYHYGFPLPAGQHLTTGWVHWKGACTFRTYLHLYAGAQGCHAGTCTYRFFETEDRWRNNLTPVTLSFPEPRIVHSLEESVADTPAGCSGSALCSAGAWTCTAAGPRSVGGTLVDRDFPGIGRLYPGAPGSPLCWEARALDYRCDGFAGAAACVENAAASGPHCFGWAEVAAATDCRRLEADPACGFVSATCAEGLSDPATGHCLLHEETWSCGRPVAVPTLARGERLECAGPVRCLGEDCVAFPRETNHDFARATAALNAAQMMALDQDCSAGECVVFAGQAYDCKRAIAGLVDCCNAPTGVSLTDYLELVMALGKLDQALDLGAGARLQGAWEILRTPFVSAWSEISRPFTSVANSLLGTTAPALSEAAAGLSLEAFKQEVLVQTARWIGSTFGEGAVNALFTAGGGPAMVGGTLDSAGLSLGGSVGSVLSWAMTAYLIYSVVTLLISLLWRCQEREYELGAKRELRACHHVGDYCKKRFLGACLERRKSYCCFNTPLARILQQQLRPQLGTGWGTAKAPVCSGLPVAQLAAVDWAGVDLDEWLAILAATGQLATPARAELERLTGSGSAFDVFGDRANAVERARLRSDGLDADGLRRAAELELWNATLPSLP